MKFAIQHNLMNEDQLLSVNNEGVELLDTLVASTKKHFGV